MARKPLTPEQKLRDKKKIKDLGLKQKDGKLRPWQENFWKAMVGCCPSADAVGHPGGPFTPEALWNMACLYFANAHEDTIIKKDFIRSGVDAGKIVEMKAVRPLSWTALSLFCSYHGVCGSLENIRKNLNGQYDHFVPVIRMIDQVISQQKYDGAAVGNFNPQLVIRDLGLAEKVDASLHQEQPLFVDTPGAPTTDSEPGTNANAPE